MWRWVPNAITAARGLAGPFVAVLLVVYGANFLGFWVFVAAIASDLIDGFLARRLGMTKLGLFLDPFADKLLVCSVWLAVAVVDYGPWWLALASVARNVLVAGVWAWYARRGVFWNASPIGQVMVAFEGVALSVLVFHGPWNGTHWPSVGTALGGISLTLSAASLVDYAIRGPKAPLPVESPS